MGRFTSANPVEQHEHGNPRRCVYRLPHTSSRFPNFDSVSGAGKVASVSCQLPVGRGKFPGSCREVASVSCQWAAGSAERLVLLIPFHAVDQVSTPDSEGLA
jgi:hypothetical protein